jgi:hypothetical protein
MKTDDLISMLSTRVEPADTRALGRRFAIAVVVGGIGAVLMAVMLLGVRPDLGEIAPTPIFLAKLAWPLAILIGASSMSMRLARPGISAMRTGSGRWWVAVPLVMLWAAGLLVETTAAPGQRIALLLGHTWRVCPFCIIGLSVPSLITIFWAMKGLAPTRLRLAGASAGLMAGSIATLAYCLHCPEMGVMFWGVWYVIGMFAPAVVGAWLGPRLLRW